MWEIVIWSFFSMNNKGDHCYIFHNLWVEIVGTLKMYRPWFDNVDITAVSKYAYMLMQIGVSQAS